MLPDLVDSLLRPRAYRRFAAEKPARTAAYVAFLSLVFVGATGAAVKLRLAPMFDQTFEWLETRMPALRFSGGAVTSSAPGPLRLEHPRAPELALVVDTARRDPVTAREMADAKALAYLTGRALYLQRQPGTIETIDLSKSVADRPIVVNADTYKEMARAFDWVFYPALMLFFFLAFAASLALFGLLYALVGMAAARAAGGALDFAAAFRVAVHAQTASSLLYALDAVLPKSLPRAQAAAAALSLAALWLGARAAASPAPPTPDA